MVAAKKKMHDGTETVPSWYFYFRKVAVGAGLGNINMFLLCKI